MVIILSVESRERGIKRIFVPVFIRHALFLSMMQVWARFILPVAVSDVTSHALLNDLIKLVVELQLSVLFNTFDNIEKLVVAHLYVHCLPVRAHFCLRGCVSSWAIRLFTFINGGNHYPFRYWLLHDAT